MASNPQQSKPPSQAKNQPNNDRPSTSKFPKKFPNTNNLLEEVMNIMDCPICFEYLRAPIFMCETGHNICGDCRQKLTLPICPMCKATITGQRNFGLEAIAAKMCSSCPNEADGCQFTAPMDKIGKHTAICTFRKRKCPLENCSWEGQLSNLENHFMESHPKHISIKSGVEVTFHNFDLSMNDNDMQLVSFDNCMFLYHVKIDTSQKIAYWAVQYVGSEKDAARWKYDFTLYYSKAAKYSNFSERCHSFEKSIQSIYDSGNCVGVPLHILNNYIQDNKIFTFKFFLRPLQRNDKDETSSTRYFHKNNNKNFKPGPRSRSRQRNPNSLLPN